MLIQHIFLLLLCWRSVGAFEKPPAEGFDDQIATASENLRVPYKTGSPLISSTETTKNPTTQSTPFSAATIHYENSNGFVPMTPIDATISETSPISTIKQTTSSDNDSKEKSVNSFFVKKAGLDNDPAYSTEARMFLNLSGPSVNRRSFDAQDRQNEFELLKVNNETPAIANYHDFYENMKSNLMRNRAVTQAGYGESKEPEAGRTIANNKWTKDRIKKIEKYLTDFHDNREHDNTDPYEQYYNGYAISNGRPISNQQKEIFEPEKVQTNFHQEIGSSIYNPYAESPNRQRTASILRSNNDDTIGMRQKSYTTVSSKIRHSKPVVVVEPSDYKIDVKYPPQQVTSKSSSVDHHRIQKHKKEPTEVKLVSRYNEETHVNREDRYEQSNERSEDIDDYSEETDYSEITERPRRINKSRRRPYSAENSRRLPKEHREHIADDLELNNSKKNNNNNNNSPTRSKLHRPKAKPSYWIEDDRDPIIDENSDEQSNNVRSKSEENTKQSSRGKGVSSWSQVAPNIEVSHSNGYQIEQIEKPKILVPVNLNLLPLPNFDHSTALGNSQGFDFTNVQNFMTATPIVSSLSPLLSTGRQSIITSGNVNSGQSTKNIGNLFNNNPILSTSNPDVIVGQNTFQNPVQAVIIPQINQNDKFPSNLRPHYSHSTIAPMFTVTQNPNVHNIAPTISSIQNFQSTSPRTSNNQNFHHMTVNPITPGISQFLLPQPTLQTLLHAPYNGNANYNILVNPNGLHGQNYIQHGNPNVHQTYSPSSSTTPQPLPSNNLQVSDSQIKKNIGTNANGRFLATASFSVGNEGHQPKHSSNIGNNKYYTSANNQNSMKSNNENYQNVNENNQARSQQPDNVYQIYRDDQNSNGKTYLQASHIVPAIIQGQTSIPLNFNGQHYVNVGGQLQEQSSVLSPSIVAQRPRDQNQQILKAANDIFEDTWKQLQQLQTNDEASRRLPYQQVYRINDNHGSTSNTNVNTVNSLTVGNSAKAQLPILSAQNVEIINPNIKPSPIDLTLMNPYNQLNQYSAAVFTTPIPIFSTTENFLSPRPSGTINLHNYVDSLTQYGAQNNNQANKIETRPDVIKNSESQRQVFNPINFVPNVDLMKSQSMLNSKNIEPLPNKLNLVPVIPGGNFFKHTQGAQSELVEKPRLSSDLEKYAEEMLRESLKTIYSTHTWNNDRRLRGNYSLAELNELAKLKNELQRFKASLLTDSKYTGKDILEGHHSETKVRTAEPSNGSTKKPELTLAEIEQLFKSDFKLNKPETHKASRNKNSRPGQLGSSRPTGTSVDNSNDFRNIKQLTDYLTPPKRNSFLSKSPFVDSPKTSKKRPGTNSGRFNSGNSRPLPRPSSLVSRPSATNPEASASNHLESGVHADRHRYEKQRSGQYSRDNNDNYVGSRHSGDSGDYRNYPTFTTTVTPENDHFKSSSSEQSFNIDPYDINHPRMHNLLGLLMKNKQLPRGSSQSIFHNEDDIRQYFENEKRRIQSEFYDDRTMSFQKKSDFPINMGPPDPPKITQIRYYPGRGKA